MPLPPHLLPHPSFLSFPFVLVSFLVELTLDFQSFRPFIEVASFLPTLFYIRANLVHADHPL